MPPDQLFGRAASHRPRQVQAQGHSCFLALDGTRPCPPLHVTQTDSGTSASPRLSSSQCPQRGQGRVPAEAAVATPWRS